MIIVGLYSVRLILDLSWKEFFRKPSELFPISIWMLYFSFPITPPLIVYFGLPIKGSFSPIFDVNGHIGTHQMATASAKPHQVAFDMFQFCSPALGSSQEADGPQILHDGARSMRREGENSFSRFCPCNTEILYSKVGNRQ